MSDDIKTGGIPLEVTVAGPDGSPITFRATPKVDDFATMKDDPNAPPKYETACSICGEVHSKVGFPLCICCKCGGFSRIVWCGQCVDCTYERFQGLPGVTPEVAMEVVEAMAPGYKAHKQKMMKAAAIKNKLDWES